MSATVEQRWEQHKRDGGTKTLEQFRAKCGKTAVKVVQKESRANWNKKCGVCGQLPTVPETGMCGPCTFGEADTAVGNW